MSDSKFVVDYIGECRAPMSVFEFAAELAENGNHGARVPKATAQHWKREIEEAISKGLLIEGEDGTIRLPAVHAGPRQMTLF